MRRFILKCAGFFMIQAALFALVLTRYDMSSETNYLAATLDKHRAMQTQGPPRIILVGGSNVAFGFETDRIERALGRPAINMGLAAGLGLEFMLDEIRPALGRGDIVVLSLEYDHFGRGPNGAQHSRLGFDPELLRQVLVFRPGGMLGLGLTHFRRILVDRGLSMVGEIARRGLLTRIRAKALDNPDLQSTRRAFNAWGDLVGHRQEPPRAAPEVIESLPIVADVRGFPSSAPLNMLREFVQWSGRRGVQVAFTFPPKPAVAVQRQADVVGRLAGELAAIPGLTLLDAPQDQTYPLEQFFDTANHLTGAGAAERTSRVIASLAGRYGPGPIRGE